MPLVIAVSADVPNTPQNTIIGGASLWVMAGKKKDEYKAVAKFLTFLSQPEVQAEFSQATGYLPITMAAYELTKKSGFYEKTPGPNIAVEQMIVKTTNNSRGVRLGNFVQNNFLSPEVLGAKLRAAQLKPAKFDLATLPLHPAFDVGIVLGRLAQLHVHHERPAAAAVQSKAGGVRAPMLHRLEHPGHVAPDLLLPPTVPIDDPRYPAHGRSPTELMA